MLLGDEGNDETGYPHFKRWFAAMQACPAVQCDDRIAVEIRARMTRVAEGKAQISMFDTKDNAARLARATTR